MIAKCSTCGAHVPSDVALTITHDGKEYSFCSAHCADAQVPDILTQLPPLPRKILVAVDGSGPSIRAVETAVTLAQASQGEIRLLAAVEPGRLREAARSPGVGARFETLAEDVEQVLRESAEAQLQRCRRICERGRVPCVTKIDTRPPLEAILAAADDVDLVVMGSRGRDALTASSLGSLAQRVVTSTAQRVLVVH